MYFAGSNLWSRKESDIDPARSSIGEISSNISVKPEVVGTSVLPASSAVFTRACHFSLPINQSNDSICKSKRFGTSSGSLILPKDKRAFFPEALADVAKWRPFVGRAL